MSRDTAASFAMVFLMLPMLYFLLASPSFLFVKLDIPPVARLLRGMFHGYFVFLILGGVIGAAGLAVAGRAGFFAMAVGVVIFAVLARRWFLRRIDAEIGSGPAGAGTVARRLRQLHVAGMLCNAVQFAAVAGTIPYIMPMPG